jgi:uncharacterized protein (TIGR03000 family)
MGSSSVCRLNVWLAAMALAAVPLASRADEEVPPDRALLVVRLPAGAKLTIGGDPTRQTGAERTFISPPLVPGKPYHYELKATWTDICHTVTASRKVPVRAGQRTVVEITAKDAAALPPAPESKARTFLFSYAAAITGLKPGDKARVWLAVPPSNEDQEVELEEEELPAAGKMGRDAEYGNHLLYFEATADKDGNVALSRTYRVTRREVRGEQKDMADTEVLQRFLRPDRLVPIEGKPLDLLKDVRLPDDQVGVARVLYEVVNRHMKYDKSGTGWGRGDAVWACDSKCGNCSDFHSLFIALARANKIPAKFEIGFPLPEKRGAGDVAGYHCWAKFRPEGKGWIPVDISEANKNPKMAEYYFGNLTEDRVAFSTGRDLTLVPKQDGEPVNFLIYPYVEVGGKPYPQEKVQKKFSYKDVP